MIEFKDKYNDESPKKDFKDYRADNSGVKEARAIAKEITLKLRKPEFIGVKSLEAKKQELISHIQSYQETFNNAERKAWKNTLRELELA